MSDTRQEITRLKTLEQQARGMAAKSPFPADRERFVAVAESYRLRALAISAEIPQADVKSPVASDGRG